MVGCYKFFEWCLFWLCQYIIIILKLKFTFVSGEKEFILYCSDLDSIVTLPCNILLRLSYIHFECGWKISPFIFWWNLLPIMLIVYHFSLQCIVLCVWILRISILWMMFCFFACICKFFWMCVLFICQVGYMYQVLCIYRHILLLQVPFYGSEMKLYISWPDISYIWTRIDWLWENLYIFKWIVVYVACHISYCSWCFNYSRNMICIEWMSLSYLEENIKMYRNT